MDDQKLPAMALRRPKIAAFAAIGLALLLAGCGGSIVPPPVSSGFTPATRPGQAPAPALSLAGLDSRALIRMFGEPRLDIRDPAVRKLQFGNGQCVLDAFLYPPKVRREPLVTYAEARRTNGDSMDLAACADLLKVR